MKRSDQESLVRVWWELSRGETMPTYQVLTEVKDGELVRTWVEEVK